MFDKLFPPKKGIERYKRYLGRRYPTLLDAFEQFNSIGGKTIVELGTSRSFVPGNRRGCMINDPKYWHPYQPRRWDWGAGIFTRMCVEHLKERRPEIHTVDVSRDAIEISKVIAGEWSDLITWHLSSSEDFLRGFEGKIDLLYIDTGEANAEGERRHLNEATIACEKQLLSPRAIVLIDDVDDPETPFSRGKQAIPYLEGQGFVVRISGFQAVLQRGGTS